jgi:SulP family sulfate permease
LVNIPNQPLLMMERIGIIPDLVPISMIFDDFKECTNWIQKNVKVIIS